MLNKQYLQVLKNRDTLPKGWFISNLHFTEGAINFVMILQAIVNDFHVQFAHSSYKGLRSILLILHHSVWEDIDYILIKLPELKN